MIISEKYKYLFIETPHTGSTAISAELIELYAGHSILNKHASFYDFNSHFGLRAENFFIFSAVRNPIDEAASVFLKFAGNHKGNYTDDHKLLDDGGWVSARKRRIFKETAHDDNFRAFLLRFYKLPFTTAINVNERFCHQILRFETLEADFFNALKTLGIEAKRSLPVLNSTDNKKAANEWVTSVEPELYLRKFGPFMREWGYMLPDGTYPKVSIKSRIFYETTKIARTFFSRYERVFPKGLTRFIHNAIG